MVTQKLPDGQLSIDFSPSKSQDAGDSLMRGRKQLAAASALETNAASVEFAVTPIGNTGSKSQANNSSSTSLPVQESGKGFGNWEVYQPAYEPWIDYLQGTGCCLFGELRAIMDLFTQQTTDRFVPRFGTGFYVGNRRYAHSYTSLLGTIINWQRRDFNAEIDLDFEGNTDTSAEILRTYPEMPIVFHISIPGKPLNAIGSKNGINLIRLLSDSYSFSCSRIDCKVRNHSWVVNFDSLNSAIACGDIVGFTDYNKFDSGDLKKNFKAAQAARANSQPIIPAEDKTRVFGSPKSDKRITFYDARPLHGVDAIDIEVRFRKKLAKAAFTSILGTSDQNFSFYESLRAIQGIVAGAIDFRHKVDGQKNVNRCERYVFWQEFVEAVGGAIRVSRPKKVISFVKQKQWVETKVYRVLGMTKELMGSAYFHRWMEDLCKRGREAMTKTQEAYIDVYRELNLHKVKFVPYRNDDISAVLVE